MRNLNIKTILILSCLILWNDYSYANLNNPMDKSLSFQIDTAELPKFVIPQKYMVVKDIETGEETIFKTGDKVVYYRKDRDKVYRKKIKSITDNSFVVESQDVLLSNIAKIKHQNLYQSFFDDVFGLLLIAFGVSIMALAGITITTLIGTVLASLVLGQVIGIFLAGILISGMGYMIFRATSRKKSSFFDLKSGGAFARIFEKT